MNYLGCLLFGLLFLAMTAQTHSGLHTRLEQTLSWIRDWSPFSYLIILGMLISAVVAIKLVATWPEQERPEDSTAEIFERVEAEDPAAEDPAAEPPEQEQPANSVAGFQEQPAGAEG